MTRKKAPPTTAADQRAALPSAVLATAATATTAAARYAEELLELVARRKAHITEAFYDIGRALRELSKKKLYSALGYVSFGELLDARRVMSRAQAHKLVTIVTTMSVKTALPLGVEKAFELARYTQATPALDTPDSLLESGAFVGDRPAAESTVQDLARATRNEKKKSAPAKKDPAEKTAEKAAKQAGTWLRKHGAKGIVAKAVRRKDGWRVVLEMTPEAAAAVFKV
jgi:hypothetical protein